MQDLTPSLLMLRFRGELKVTCTHEMQMLHGDSEHKRRTKEARQKTCSPNGARWAQGWLRGAT